MEIDAMTEPEIRSVQVRDGRELCVRVSGGDFRRSVFVMHGTPGSGLLYRRWIEDAAERRIRLVSYDRPGYGGSSERPGRSIADCAADVTAVADELGIDRMGVWGWSGGGPYALACAATLPDRVVAAAVLAGGAPWDAPGLDFFDGMGQDNIDDIDLYFSDPDAARKKNLQDRNEVLATTVDQQTEMLASLLSATDAAVLTGEFAEWLLRAEQNGLAAGDQGWWDDGVAQFSPWGFDLASVRVPVKVWHGRHDQFLPVQHGRWLAEHIPGAESALSDSDGHLTLVIERIGDVHDWLINHF
ncbi:MAG: alpha/beta fold hydrolase [Solirubrobacteraceae bacterium]